MKILQPRRKYQHAYKENARPNPYRSSQKPKNHPKCTDCGAMSVNGRWLSSSQVKKRGELANSPSEAVCPACQQCRDQFAQGVVEIRGATWKEHAADVMNTIRNTESIARHRNDQQRILWVKDLKTLTKVYVSLPELARQIGRTLEKSFQGHTEYAHSSEEPFIRVRWYSDLPRSKHRPGRAFRELIADERQASELVKASRKSRAFRSRAG